MTTTINEQATQLGVLDTEPIGGSMRHTALVTGLAYVGLAVTGMIGYLAVRGQLYVDGDAATTAANLVSHESLARVGVAVDLAGVLTQALVAVWFFKLFRGIESLRAALIAAFGLMNAAIMLVATVFSATALDVALGHAADGTANRTSITLLMYDLSATAWRVGALFFGLWLIPMGWCAIRATYLSSVLGRILMIGGVGYILSGFVDFLVANASGAVYALTVPATIGEFWMVGSLLLVRLRRPTHVTATRKAPAITTYRPTGTRP